MKTAGRLRVVLVAMCAAAARVRAAPPPEGEAWLRTQSAHFTVYGLALHGLGRACFLLEADLAEGIAAAQKAHELLPNRPDVTLDLLSLVAASGETDLAIAIFERDLRRETADPEYLRSAEGALAYGAMKRAVAAACAKDPAVRDALAERLARLNSVLAQNRFAELFEQATERAKAEDWTSARGLYEEAARTAPDAQRKASAEEMARRPASIRPSRKRISAIWPAH